MGFLFRIDNAGRATHRKNHIVRRLGGAHEHIPDNITFDVRGHERGVVVEPVDVGLPPVDDESDVPAVLGNDVGRENRARFLVPAISCISIGESLEEDVEAHAETLGVATDSSAHPQTPQTCADRGLALTTSPRSP